jgi:hypothetical protein
MSEGEFLRNMPDGFSHSYQTQRKYLIPFIDSSFILLPGYRFCHFCWVQVPSNTKDGCFVFIHSSAVSINHCSLSAQDYMIHNVKNISLLLVVSKRSFVPHLYFLQVATGPVK